MFRDSPDRRRPADLALGLTFNGNTAADCSGYGHVGTLTNGATISSGALVCGGTNEYLSFPDAASLDMPAAFSMSCWLQPSSPNLTRIIAAKYNSVGNLRSYQVWADYAAGRFQAIVSSNGALASGFLNYVWATTMPTSGWNHLLWVVDTSLAGSGTRMKLYLNGTALTASTIFGDASGFTPLNNNVELSVGGGVAGSNPWKGNLDDFFLFRRALTANEGKQLYYRGRT